MKNPQNNRTYNNYSTPVPSVNMKRRDLGKVNRQFTDQRQLENQYQNKYQLAQYSMNEKMAVKEFNDFKNQTLDTRRKLNTQNN